MRSKNSGTPKRMEFNPGENNKRKKKKGNKNKKEKGLLTQNFHFSG